MICLRPPFYCRIKFSCAAMSAADSGALLLVSAIFWAGLTHAASMKKDLSRATKSVDLVSVLKEDLRKNNDDYKDLRDPPTTSADIRNPYLGNGDEVISESEAKSRKNFDLARRNFQDTQKSQNEGKPHDTNPTLPPKDTKLNDKHMLHDKGAEKNEKTETQSQKLHFKNVEEKIKSDEKFLKSHRKSIPTNNDESVLHDIQMKKEENFEIWKPVSERKVFNKNAMLHDKQHKRFDNKLMLQDTKSGDKPSKPEAKKPIDWLKVSSETEGAHLKNQRSTKTPESRGFVTKTASNIDARRKRNKYEKLHQLLDKEGLLSKFLKSGPRGRGVAGGAGAGGGGRGRGGGEMRHRAFEIESDMEAVTLPADTIPSEELDMLPATGERVEALKRKGRFCHRHILFPEGPKYDSRGRVYEPGHADQQAARKRERNFAHTKLPQQVLPKCCNCCKKSVLGCE
ncbi:uncharacterized protein LOC128681084 [Plodia interpunctella]|uniref:uncharacterized protein LOC128681084 n=1 Tax=Plodia interpunctella TaxID=58824 RepID=UPI0023674DD1|nr:uncharacterized protein LOC128681084 [Plodia interpunctella]